MSKKRGREERQARILKALGHPVRLQIVQALSEKSWCVCDLAENLDVRQAYLSQQLAYLRRTGIVRGKKDGLQVEYSVNVPHLRALLEAIGDVVNGT